MTGTASLRSGGRTAGRYTPEQIHTTLCERVKGLRAELDAEMAARARAEAELDEALDLMLEVQRRMDGVEDENRRLWRMLGSRLAQGALPFSLAGVTGGFAAVALLRAVLG